MGGQEINKSSLNQKILEALIPVKGETLEETTNHQIRRQTRATLQKTKREKKLQSQDLYSREIVFKTEGEMKFSSRKQTKEELVGGFCEISLKIHRFGQDPRASNSSLKSDLVSPS